MLWDDDPGLRLRLEYADVAELQAVAYAQFCDDLVEEFLHCGSDQGRVWSEQFGTRWRSRAQEAAQTICIVGVYLIESRVQYLCAAFSIRLV